MAQRRMFSLKIIDTDLFLDMPCSSQLLYFHLSMRADDDGFIASPKKITKMVNCSDDDMKLLIAKSFVIPFESGLCVIKHWRIHNYIQKDRYTETIYKEEMAQLQSLNGVYGLDIKCIHDVSKKDTQVRLGKDRLELGKDRLLLDENSSSKDDCSNKLLPIIDKWNSLNLPKIISIKGNRLKLLNSRIKEYGEDKILDAIENIRTRPFLQGQNNRGWVITFDWLIKPNNFIKVLEGNYKDKQQQPHKHEDKKSTFNNFNQRNYDFEDLEKKLLGWED